MGRTGPTVREQLDRLERDWRPFRRSLRRRHRPAFDRLFERARGHADAASQQNPRDPWRAFVVAVLLAHEAELRALRERRRERDASGGSGGSGGDHPGGDGPRREDRHRDGDGEADDTDHGDRDGDGVRD